MHPVVIELVRYRNIILGRIVSQDDTIIDRGNTSWIDRETGIEIWSATHPALGRHSINLRGEDRSRDDQSIYCFCSSQEEASTLIDKLATAIKNFNAMLEGR